MSKGLATLAKKTNPADLINGITSIVNTITEYKKIKEVESTKRIDIQAKKEIAIQTIESQKEVILTFFEHTYKERDINFSRMFNVLDKAIENKDSDAVDKTLLLIKSTIEKNPISDFGEFKNNLLDNSVEIEF